MAYGLWMPMDAYGRYICRIQGYDSWIFFVVYDWKILDHLYFMGCPRFQEDHRAENDGAPPSQLG